MMMSSNRSMGEHVEHEKELQMRVETATGCHMLAISYATKLRSAKERVQVGHRSQSIVSTSVLHSVYGMNDANANALINGLVHQVA